MSELRIPDCFRDKDQYLEWQRLRRRSTENVTICDDCTAHHRGLMQQAKRCDIVFWNKNEPFPHK